MQKLILTALVAGAAIAGSFFISSSQQNEDVLRGHPKSTSFENIEKGVSRTFVSVYSEHSNTNDVQQEASVLTPNIVCRDSVSVNLSFPNNAVDASVFVISFEPNCPVSGNGTLGIRRMGDPTFGPSVLFSCDDLGVDTIMVEARVLYDSGDSIACMVPVGVNDNIAPIMTEDLPDITISCEFDLDENDLSAFGTVVFNEADRNDIIINDTFYVASNGFVGRDGLVSENCPFTSTITESSVSNLNTCNQGTITRTFTITDESGNSGTIDQLITVIDVLPFTEADIVWPADLDLNDCTTLPPDPLVSGFPLLLNQAQDLCNFVGATFDDQIFNVPTDGCPFIRRTWTVTDWCQFVPNSPTSEGRWTSVQNIQVINSIAPDFISSCADTIICAPLADCIAPVLLTASAEDDCTSADFLVYQYTIDLNDDGTDDINGLGNTYAADIEVGNTHRITWFTEDRCGNSNSCSYLFSVVDCKAPTPVCKSVAVSLGLDGEAELWATTIDDGSNDNCTDQANLTYSFSSNPADVGLVFTCDDVGEQTVELWVTDEAGNDSYCSITIEIQDNFNICPSNNTIESGRIAGHVITEEEVDLEETKVNILGPEMEEYEMTEESGIYAFDEIEMHYDYTIIPERDIDDKEGISTLDLVIIQRHILGLESLDSPYKRIAADANNSESISGADIVQLRKLILGVYDILPDNSSWRFVDRLFEFDDPSHPWPFKEEIELTDLSADETETDFIGIKIGDVNGSINDNLLQKTTENRSSQIVDIILEDKIFRKGDIVEIPVRTRNFHEIMALQWTVTFDDNALTYLETEGLALPLKKYEIAYPNKERPSLTMAWSSVNDLTINDGDKLLNLVFVAQAPGKLSEVLRIGSALTEARAYNALQEEAGLNFIFEEASGNAFVLLQNSPNPFSSETNIRFEIPNTMNITFSIYDSKGSSLYSKTEMYNAGTNRIKITDKELQGAAGILYYNIKGDGFNKVKKMIRIK